MYNNISWLHNILIECSYLSKYYIWMEWIKKRLQIYRKQNCNRFEIKLDSLLKYNKYLIKFNYSFDLKDHQS